MRSALTRHARVRCQQRGIPHFAVDWVLQHGRCTHDHRGGEIWFLDRRARQGLTQVFGPRAEKLCNTYVVLVDGRAVTVGHRHKRMTRN